MGMYFVDGAEVLQKKTKEITDQYRLAKRMNAGANLVIPEQFQREFFDLVDRVNLSLLEDQDNFYGYFLFQMARELRFDISSPTGVNFKGAKYIIYFNPILFLNLSLTQMETSIKHEILHIVSMHLTRARDLKRTYTKLAINMAMDIVVNQFLNYLPPYATTLAWVNFKYALQLEAFQPFEYYVENIQTALDSLEHDAAPKEENNLKETIETETIEKDMIEKEYNVNNTHDIWEESNELDEKTLQEFTEKAIQNSEKGKTPSYLTGLIDALKNSRGELPWNLYLNRLLGTIESNLKKTVTRRNRRQPERLDLRGQLRNHKANIVVAIDISGSISDDEFKQALKEIISIVHNYNHEITIVECDDEIRREYKVKSEKDMKERIPKRGATKYSPVFDYANRNKINLLVYFTDGKGEDTLKIIPRGYKVLWVISGRGDELSLKEPFGAVKRLKPIKKVENGPEIGEIVRTGYSMQHEESV